MYRRQSSLDVATDNRRDFLCIIQNELIGDSHGNTLFTTVNCPDQSTVRRIKLLYSGLLFDHFRTVQTESRFRRHHDVARKPRRQGHAAETSDGARDYRDDWSRLPQRQDGRHHFGDSIESQVGFLQTHTACFEQQDRDRFLTVLRISSCEIEGGRHLSARDLAHAARLEPSFKCNDDGRLTGDRAFENNAAIIELWCDALLGQPGRFDPVEWADQLAPGTRIHQALRPRSGIQFDKALPQDKFWNHRCIAHDSITSTARSSRSITLPGVAPASLISMRTAPSYFEKKRSSTAFQLSPKPFTLVKTETCAKPASAGSMRTSMSPEPTTPMCAFLTTG